MKGSITRFTPSERWLHNIVMVTFVLLLLTGLAMLYFNLQGDQGESRKFLVSSHKLISVIFMVIPVLLVALGNRKIWKENFRLVTSWSRKDIEWLMKKPLAAIFKNMELPLDDKFNPGQKTWAYIAISGSALLVGTGIIMWTTGSPILALLVHTLVALMLALALTGHIYMAIGNKATRPSISSIIDGDVSMDWAMRHHPLWAERVMKDRVKRKAVVPYEAPLFDGEATAKVAWNKTGAVAALDFKAPHSAPAEAHHKNRRDLTQATAFRVGGAE
ncbi:MAG: cytochrome b/b6 domain-containing protein [Nitrospinae bacterium]|nr:cytochrome b/b6 domain-containing protein [Nitrospinota bacterium]